MYQVAHLYLLRNFEEIALKSEELIQMPMEELHAILNDDLLNVKDEYLVWECILRWVEHDRESRQIEIPKLLSSIRLGCLNATVTLWIFECQSTHLEPFFLQYFMDNIINHKYVVNNAETQPIVLEVLNFLHDLNDLGSHQKKVCSTRRSQMKYYTLFREQIITPRMAVPRIPHDVIFLTGGWQNRPVSVVETYDTRADRWVNVPNRPDVARCYHGTAVIGHKLYAVGGFDGRNFFNTCCVFDALDKTWREVVLRPTN